MKKKKFIKWLVEHEQRAFFKDKDILNEYRCLVSVLLRFIPEKDLKKAKKRFRKKFATEA